MGSIYKISQDGAVLYRASKSITITDPLTGLKKRKRITGTGATAAIAISRMNDNLQERGGGILPSPQEKNQEKHLFSVWFYEWLQGLPGERVSDIVKHNYKGVGSFI